MAVSPITIEIPYTYQSERQYVIQLMLGEFLGLQVKIMHRNRDDVRLHICDGRELLFADRLFQTPADSWLKPTSLPQSPLDVWNVPESIEDINLVDRAIPIIYGDDPAEPHFLCIEEERIRLGLDIFGSAFFMLTRYEEAVLEQRDDRKRFSAATSLAYREDFLLRPIVNEYLEILWWALQRLWPQLERRRWEYSVSLSHDVDIPLCVVGKSSWRVLRSMVGDVAYRRDPVLAIDRARSFGRARKRGADHDLANTFDFIMDTSEYHGVSSSFYFLAQGSIKEEDARYLLTDPWIRELMSHINDRGHEIGYHASYSSYDKPALITDEFRRLVRICEEEGIVRNQWGGRQHYLRWANPVTWQGWENAGLDYDTTLTFHDHVGFRCGICYEYPVFNLETKRQLRLQERPLIAMEGTIFSYMKIDSLAILEMMAMLVHRCRQFGGTMSLLWHNSSLLSRKDRELYRKVVSSLFP